MQTWRHLRAVVVLCLCGSATLFAQPAAQSPLQWGADSEGGAPYIFKAPSDPDLNIGFEVDLIDALKSELKRPIEFRQYNYVNLLNGLDRGDFDFAMNGLEVTADRARQVRFTRPYYIYRLQLVARRNDNRFTSLAELKQINGRVGTLDETAASRLLDRMQIEGKLYDSQAEPYQDLELDRIDAVLMDLPIAIYYARSNPKLQFIGEPVEKGYYAIAVSKDNEPLVEELDGALGRLIASPKLKEIYDKWGLWDDEQRDLVSTERSSLENILQDSGKSWSLVTYFPLLCRAALVTVGVSIASMVLAVGLGLPVSLARLYGPRPLQWAAVAYVEFFRGIPVLLLLYLLYYGIPSVLNQYGLADWFKPSDYAVAILAFGLNYAAYEAEIYRAGIAAVPDGQWEAASSLGMSRIMTFRRIILPQALRTILPPMTNDFVALFKDTSLVSVIAIVELTKQYQILAKSSLKYLEIGLATAVLYLVMSIPLGHLARGLERRWGRLE